MLKISGDSGEPGGLATMHPPVSSIHQNTANCMKIRFRYTAQGEVNLLRTLT